MTKEGENGARFYQYGVAARQRQQGRTVVGENGVGKEDVETWRGVVGPHSL